MDGALRVSVRNMAVKSWDLAAVVKPAGAVVCVPAGNPTLRARVGCCRIDAGGLVCDVFVELCGG